MCACAQSGVADEEMLSKLLDRTHLAQEGAPLPYPKAGVGYEVVVADSGKSLLSSI